jgi:hypothetical protein
MHRIFMPVCAMLLFSIPTLAEAQSTVSGTLKNTITVDVKVPVRTGEQVWCSLSMDFSGESEGASVQASKVSGTTYKCVPTLNYKWVVASPLGTATASFGVSIIDPNLSASGALLVGAARRTSQSLTPFTLPPNGHVTSLTSNTDL